MRISATRKFMSSCNSSFESSRHADFKNISLHSRLRSRIKNLFLTQVTCIPNETQTLTMDNRVVCTKPSRRLLISQERGRQFSLKQSSFIFYLSLQFQNNRNKDTINCKWQNKRFLVWMVVWTTLWGVFSDSYKLFRSKSCSDIMKYSKASQDPQRIQDLIFVGITSYK